MEKNLSPKAVKALIEKNNTIDRSIRDIKALVEDAKKSMFSLREASSYNNINNIPQMKLMFDVYAKSLTFSIKSISNKFKHYFELIGLDNIELTEHNHNNTKPKPQTATDHQKYLKLLSGKILKNLTEVDSIIYLDYHSETILEKMTQTYRVYMPRLIKHTAVYKEVFSSFIELSRKERDEKIKINEITPNKILETAKKLNQKLPRLVIKK